MSIEYKIKRAGKSLVFSKELKAVETQTSFIEAVQPVEVCEE